MRRVCRPGGIVAARDSDYAASPGTRQLPELDEWMALYQRIARANGGEPDAGRRLLSWAREAGFEKVDATSTNWAFTDEDDRAWWGGMWADRILQSAMADQARGAGVPEGMSPPSPRLANLGRPPRRLDLHPARRTPLHRLARALAGDLVQDCCCCVGGVEGAG